MKIKQKRINAVTNDLRKAIKAYGETYRDAYAACHWEATGILRSNLHFWLRDLPNGLLSVVKELK